MNKKIIAALFGAAIILPCAAHAQAAAGQGYIGANVGSAEYKVSVDGLGSETKDKTAFKVYGGLQATKYVGVEVGYVNFGKVSESATDGIDTASVSIRTQSGYLALTGTVPLNEQFALFGKVGVARNSTKVRASLNDESASDTTDKTRAMYGIGAAYAVTPKVSVVAEYEDFGKVLSEQDVDFKLKMWSLGLRYKF